MTGERPMLASWAAAGPGIGYGHVVRSGALAEAWHDAGGRAVLCTSVSVPGLAGIVDVDQVVVDRSATMDLDRVSSWAQQLKRSGASWVSIDDPRVSRAAVRALREAGLRVLAVVDHGQPSPGETDLLVDQNAGAPVAFRGALDQRVGVRYALIRRRLRSVSARRERVGARERVVGLLGGMPSAPTIAFASNLAAQLGRSGVSVDLVAGGADVPIVARNVRVHRFIQNPADLFASATVACSTAGSTTWELAGAGVPSVLFAVAPDQMPIGREVSACGAAVFLGHRDDTTVATAIDAVRSLLENEEDRRVMSERGRQLVDGLGASRIVSRMRADTIQLRPACVNDAALLFDWANDATVRAMSMNHDQIPWTDHVRWMREQLDRPVPGLYVASVDGEPIGQIRFDPCRDALVEVGLSIDARHRGRHLAAPLIVAGCRTMFARGAREVVAKVRVENEASARAFASADFDEMTTATSTDGIRWYRLAAGRWSSEGGRHAALLLDR
jgi:spore coat polysaccharide biosynthesis predicted glycosyltransferase SpsG/L-amino acid N-acyltransferase YncA